MFVFPSHTSPRSRRDFPYRSRPRLLTDAAYGGLGPPTARRPRRTYLHHWPSTVHLSDLLHRFHSPFRTHAGNHRNPDGTSAPPAFRIPWPPPFGRFCPPPSAHPELSPRHAVSVSPPPSPEAESNSPRTSCSKSDKGCSSDRLRSPRSSTRPLPALPCWP